MRPERIKIKAVPEEGDVWLQCRIKEKIYSGFVIKTIATTRNGKEIVVNEPIEQRSGFGAKEDIFVTWKPEHSIVIKA
ncbi:hypothetical protein SDC9_171841 [bioreactor metagenome]|uniref:Transport-associated OB type 2 domain-containing protein n=1 Tax=bioreactor metagenome TaxID=1076179 RepID=A0A645GEK2_9ZZZZ